MVYTNFSDKKWQFPRKGEAGIVTAKCRTITRRLTSLVSELPLRLYDKTAEIVSLSEKCTSLL